MTVEDRVDAMRAVRRVLSCGTKPRPPPSVMSDLLQRAQEELSSTPDERICRGTLLSRAQYLSDLQDRAYRDARLHSRSHMTADDIAHWTAAIDQSE